MGGSTGGAENIWGGKWGGVRRPDWRKGELVGVRRPPGTTWLLPAA